MKTLLGPLKRVNYPVVSANGGKVEVLGQVNASFTTDNSKCAGSFVFLVSPNVNSKCILGADFLQSHKVILDVAGSKCIFPNKKIEKTRESAPKEKRTENEKEAVTISSRCTLAPFSEKAVVVQTAFCNQEVQLLVSTRHGQDSLLTTDDNGRALMILQNGSATQVEFARKDKIGRCSIHMKESQKRDVEWKLNSVSRGAKTTRTPTVLEKVPLSHLPLSLQNNYGSILSQFPDVFSLNPNDIGHCQTLPQHILLKDDKRITCIPPYRTSPHLQPVVEEYVNNLLEAKVIQKSTSPFCSPLLLVKKANSTPQQPLIEQFRVVHDYRSLNDNTVRDSYPLHNLYDLIDKVAAAKVWSVIDLSSGFWNQSLSADSRKYTAFAVPGLGHFQYTRSAQGLCNSPPAFQRLLDFIVRDIPGVYVYVDDLVICSQTHEDHLTALKEVLLRFRKYNLKCRPHKVQIATAEINYLGYNLSHANGIRPGEMKTKAIAAWPPPSNIKEVRQFLGLCSFFRRTIKDFSTTASPITKLTRKDSTWTQGELPPEAMIAFQRLKRQLTSRPCVRAPDFKRQFILTVDASKVGLGAVLSQAHPSGVEHPIAYASRTLTAAEQKQAPFHLEYLAMVWACRHFKPYLVGARFILRSDHKPLQVLNKVKGQTLDRYLLELSQYDFEVQYLKGEIMPADGLSRQVASTNTSSYPLQINISWSQLKQLQMQDPELKSVVVYKLFRKLPYHPRLKAFALKWNASTNIADGVLVSAKTKAALAPTGLRQSLLRMAHDSPASGHYDARRTLFRLNQSWYWPTIEEDVKWYCKSCILCKQQNKSWSNAPIPLGSLPPSHIFNERVHVDLLGPLPDNEGKKYLLVTVDAFSKFIQVKALPDKSMESVASAFYDSWISLFAVPKHVVSDLGSEFHNKLFKFLSLQFGFEHSFSAPQHPQSNGQAEVSVRETLRYVRKFVEGNEWKVHLPNLRLAHNTCFNSSIRTTPYMAAFSRLPSLPLDIIKSTKSPGPYYGPSYLTSHIHHFSHIRDGVMKNNQDAYDAMKCAHDRRAKGKAFQRGDKVFVRQPHSGKQFQKFQARYSGPYVIIRVLNRHNVWLAPYSPHAKRKRPFLAHSSNLKLAPALLHLYDPPLLPAAEAENLPVPPASPGTTAISPKLDDALPAAQRTPVTLSCDSDSPNSTPAKSPTSSLYGSADDRLPTPTPPQNTNPGVQTRSKSGPLPDSILHSYPNMK